MTTTIEVNQLYELKDCPLCRRSPEVIRRDGAIIIKCSLAKFSTKSGHILSVYGIDVKETVENWNALVD